MRLLVTELESTFGKVNGSLGYGLASGWAAIVLPPVLCTHTYTCSNDLLPSEASAYKSSQSKGCPFVKHYFRVQPIHHLSGNRRKPQILPSRLVKDSVCELMMISWETQNVFLSLEGSCQLRPILTFGDTNDNMPPELHPSVS